MNNTHKYDKLFASQVGIIKLPKGYCGIVKDNLDDLLGEIETNFNLNEFERVGSVSIQQNKVGEEIIFPKIKYRFKEKLCFLEVIFTSTKNLKKSVLTIKHSFEYDLKEFIKKSDNVIMFFDNADVLNKNLHKIILSFCQEMERKKLFMEIGSITIPRIFIIRSEEDRVRMEEISEAQLKEGDKLIDEMIREKESSNK